MTKQDIFSIIIIIVIIGFLFLGIFYFGEAAIKDVRNYKSYKKFCEERQDFCYCEHLECSFKAKYVNGVPSEDVKELCDLARSLNDSSMYFDFSCMEEGA